MWTIFSIVQLSESRSVAETTSFDPTRLNSSNKRIKLQKGRNKATLNLKTFWPTITTTCRNIKTMQKKSNSSLKFQIKMSPRIPITEFGSFLRIYMVLLNISLLWVDNDNYIKKESMCPQRNPCRSSIKVEESCSPSGQVLPPCLKPSRARADYAAWCVSKHLDQFQPAFMGFIRASWWNSGLHFSLRRCVWGC